MKTKSIRGQIGIFGRRNNGKSSLINTIAGQDVAIVSEIAGTTTDPVRKVMEINGLGPVVLIDTAGIDDIGQLGEKRIAKTKEILKTIDLAILIIAQNTFGAFEKELVSEFREFEVPFFVVHNKSDLTSIYPETQRLIKASLNTEVLDFSCSNSPAVDRLVGLIRKFMPESAMRHNTLVGDLIS
ncbi:MAG TPA: GTP-binding protein, partial [Bacteroidales bacterium]|nr:GTP-binding protein [Bacteroidales bacterium]